MKKNVLFIIVFCVFIISCGKTKYVLTKVVKSDETDLELFYDNKGELLKIIDENGKTIPNPRNHQKENHVYDQKNRLVYNKYKSGFIYETYLKYNDEGLLVQIISKKGLETNGIFKEWLNVTTTDYLYKDGILVKVKEDDEFVRTGEVLGTHYDVFYKEEISTDVEFTKKMYSSILPISFSDYGSDGLKVSNKLIKSILNFNGEESIMYEYNYDFDENKNIVSMSVVSNEKSYNYKNEDFKPWVLKYKFFYTKL